MLLHNIYRSESELSQHPWFKQEHVSYTGRGLQRATCSSVSRWLLRCDLLQTHTCFKFMGQTYLLEMSHQKYENFKCLWLFSLFKKQNKNTFLLESEIFLKVCDHKGTQASDRETSTHRADSDGI